jgi:hypothetical protein
MRRQLATSPKNRSSRSIELKRKNHPKTSIDRGLGVGGEVAYIIPEKSTIDRKQLRDVDYGIATQARRTTSYQDISREPSEV